MTMAAGADPTVRRPVEPGARLPRWLTIVLGIPVVMLVVGSPVWFASDIGDIASRTRGTTRYVYVESNATRWGVLASLLLAAAVWFIGTGAYRRWQSSRTAAAELVANGDGVWLLRPDGSNEALGLAGTTSVAWTFAEHDTTVTTDRGALHLPYVVDHPDDAADLERAVAGDGRVVTSSGAERLGPRPWSPLDDIFGGNAALVGGLAAVALAGLVIGTQELSSGFLDPDVDIGDVEVNVEAPELNLGTRASESVAFGSTGTVGSWEVRVLSTDDDAAADLGTTASDGERFVLVEIEARNVGPAATALFPVTFVGRVGEARYEWTGGPCGVRLDQPESYTDRPPGDVVVVPLCFAVPEAGVADFVVDVGGIAVGETVELRLR